METCIYWMHWQSRMTIRVLHAWIFLHQLASGLGHLAALALAFVEVLLGHCQKLSTLSCALHFEVFHFQQNTHMSFPFQKPRHWWTVVCYPQCDMWEIMKDVPQCETHDKMSWKIVASLHHIIDPEIVKYRVASTQGPFLLLMTSSKHEGEPRSVKKKKGNWVIKLSNESNAIIKTPKSSQVAQIWSNLSAAMVVVVVLFSGDKVKRHLSWFLDIHLPTHLPSIDPSIHSFICTQDLCECVCILGYDWLHYTAGSLDIIVHKQKCHTNIYQLHPIAAPTHAIPWHGTIIST